MSLSRFHNPWLNFGFRAAEVGVAAQSVIALRMLHLASGGTRAYNEIARMDIEKMTAFAEAQVAAGAAMAGHNQNTARTAL
jgi:hypothetical protein